MLFRAKNDSTRKERMKKIKCNIRQCSPAFHVREAKKGVRPTFVGVSFQGRQDTPGVSPSSTHFGCPFVQERWNRKTLRAQTNYVYTQYFISSAKFGSVEAGSGFSHTEVQALVIYGAVQRHRFVVLSFCFIDVPETNQTKMIAFEMIV